MVTKVENVAEAAGVLLLEKARASVEERGRFVLVLSGGSTPLKLYTWLTEGHTDKPFWAHTHIFWGDERFVPHDHPDSNYGAARAALLDRLAIPTEQIHPWPYMEGNPDAAAAEYADTLQELDDAFDLTFLGLGDDAHTASLFPGTGAVFDEGSTTVVRPPGKETRLSLTVSRLNRSRTVAFLVQGEPKRGALEATLSPADAQCDFNETPARAIRAQEDLLWLTDVEL